MKLTITWRGGEAVLSAADVLRLKHFEREDMVSVLDFLSDAKFELDALYSRTYKRHASDFRRRRALAKVGR